MLKEWDHHRATFLNSHRNLIETLMGKVDRRVKSSQDFMHILVRFFGERASQESNYAKHPIPKPEAVVKLNDLCLTVYANYSEALTILDEANIEHCKKVAYFTHLLENKIVREVLVKEYDEYDRTIENARHQLLLVKNQLNSHNIKSSEKSSKLATL